MFAACLVVSQEVPGMLVGSVLRCLLGQAMGETSFCIVEESHKSLSWHGFKTANSNRLFLQELVYIYIIFFFQANSVKSLRALFLFWRLFLTTFSKAVSQVLSWRWLQELLFRGFWGLRVPADGYLQFPATKNCRSSPCGPLSISLPFAREIFPLAKPYFTSRGRYAHTLEGSELPLKPMDILKPFQPGFEMDGTP